MSERIAFYTTGWTSIGKSNTGDYHNEMNSQRSLEWLEEDVFPKIRGQVPVIVRAPYHLVRTPETRPARTEMRTAKLADSLVAHDVVLDEWCGTWQTSKTKAELMA